MLACRRYYDDKQGKPWLVWLHGLLGNQQDWAAVLPLMQDWPCLTVDLPGHGESANIKAQSFAEVDRLLKETLRRQKISRYVLIGYSLGGRIALYHACGENLSRCNGLSGLAIEGANPGLPSDDEKQQRIRHDRAWAEKFRRRPIADVLNEWYQQPVFSDLTQSQREQLINDRKHNNGRQIADMLEATSLGKQPWLGECLSNLISHSQLAGKLPFCYLCGENDDKFQQLAADYQLPLKTIVHAGHNAHRSNPQGFAQQLSLFLKEC